jgi:hypothetical protein
MRASIVGFIVVFVAAIAMPYSAIAQSKSSDCPISKWSKTGAACNYAPDLPPSRRVPMTPAANSTLVFPPEVVDPIGHVLLIPRSLGPLDSLMDRWQLLPEIDSTRKIRRGEFKKFFQ